MVRRAAFAALLIVGAGGCAASAPSTPPAPAASRLTPTAPALPPQPTAPTHSPDPGRLPQTMASPSATDPAFAARMRQFWAGVANGRPTAALPAFFPLGAYRQVKALSDPAADWRDRLVALYDLDLGAAHRLVGPGATLEGVDVPAAAATWVRPGEEYNKIGYWRVYGTRVRYRTAVGTSGSFGIFSMISWRGQWYVVHLGPVARPAGTATLVR